MKKVRFDSDNDNNQVTIEGTGGPDGYLSYIRSEHLDTLFNSPKQIPWYLSRCRREGHERGSDRQHPHHQTTRRSPPN